jgi:hypothetical protein
MAYFKFPIDRSNEHTLDRCGMLKRSANVTAKTFPPPINGGGSNRAPVRGGGTQDSDDRSRGRGWQVGTRNSGNQKASDAAPPTQFTQSSNS